MRKKNTINNGAAQKAGVGVRQFVLAIWAFLNLFPFWWIAMSSFKTNDGIFTSPLALPEGFMTDNYVALWRDYNLPRAFGNSVFISVATIAILLLICAMGAYGIVRTCKGRALQLYFNFGIMVPIHAVITPVFYIVKNMGLLRTYPGIILVFVASNVSLTINLLMGFIKQMPIEVEEAAHIDGCSRTATFFRVVFPMLKPCLATVGILAFNNSWNDFIYSNLMAGTNELRPLTLTVYTLKKQFDTDYGLITAGLVCSITPLLIFFLLFQEQVVKGMVAGAVKG